MHKQMTQKHLRPYDNLVAPQQYMYMYLNEQHWNLFYINLSKFKISYTTYRL